VPCVVTAGAENRPPDAPLHAFYEAAQWLADCLGVPVVEVPGGHVPHASHPETFAAALRAVLRDVTRSSPPTQGDLALTSEHRLPVVPVQETSSARSCVKALIWREVLVSSRRQSRCSDRGIGADAARLAGPRHLAYGRWQSWLGDVKAGHLPPEPQDRSPAVAHEPGSCGPRACAPSGPRRGGGRRRVRVRPAWPTELTRAAAGEDLVVRAGLQSFAETIVLVATATGLVRLVVVRPADFPVVNADPAQDAPHARSLISRTSSCNSVPSNSPGPRQPKTS
jgi:hypothetical protein